LVNTGIKVAAADIAADMINAYFRNLADSIKDVPPASIWIFDETKSSDDPGRKKYIHERGLKVFIIFYLSETWQRF